MSDFTESAQDIAAAEALLEYQVKMACENPEKHEPKQHRDRQPPWCKLCGRTKRGELVGTPQAKLVAPEEYTREMLIDLCEKGVVHFDKWTNRDSSDAQIQLGQAWVLLKAGVPFIVLDGTNHPDHSESHLGFAWTFPALMHSRWGVTRRKATGLTIPHTFLHRLALIGGMAAIGTDMTRWSNPLERAWEIWVRRVNPTIDRAGIRMAFRAGYLCGRRDERRATKGS